MNVVIQNTEEKFWNDTLKRWVDEKHATVFADRLNALPMSMYVESDLVEELESGCMVIATLDGVTDSNFSNDYGEPSTIGATYETCGAISLRNLQSLIGYTDWYAVATVVPA